MDGGKFGSMAEASLQLTAAYLEMAEDATGGSDPMARKRLLARARMQLRGVVQQVGTE